MNDITTLIIGIIGAILLVLVVSVALGVIVMLLWNELMPYLFDLPTISFWQAVGLTLLCKILFNSNATINN